MSKEKELLNEENKLEENNFAELEDDALEDVAGGKIPSPIKSPKKTEKVKIIKEVV